MGVKGNSRSFSKKSKNGSSAVGESETFSLNLAKNRSARSELDSRRRLTYGLHKGTDSNQQFPAYAVARKVSPDSKAMWPVTTVFRTRVGLPLGSVVISEGIKA